MTVGGGLRKLADIGDALQSGADKVSINTAALAFPDLLREAAYTFGSQAIVLSVQAKRRSASFWEAFGESGREPSGRSVVEWVAQAIDLGVGEVLLTSIDKDGTRSGFDLPLIRAVAETCSVPLMVSGGAGSVEHIIEVVSISGVDAVVAGSVLHYGNLTIPKIKEALNNAGFATRPASEAPIVSENEHCGNRTGATDKE